MSSESDAFPDPVFELLLDKLVHALEITQSSQSTLTPQTRQAIFQASTAFKDGLAKAREIANDLPGGEMHLEEQLDVIAMLEKIRDRKRAQLLEFSRKSLQAGTHFEDSVRLEVDSTASSPHP